MCILFVMSVYMCSMCIYTGEFIKVNAWLYKKKLHVCVLNNIMFTLIYNLFCFGISCKYSCVDIVRGFVTCSILFIHVIYVTTVNFHCLHVS